MSSNTESPADTRHEMPVFKTPVHQLADAYRRSVNRAKLDKMQRQSHARP